jgi:pyruvate,water dikinase
MGPGMGLLAVGIEATKSLLVVAIAQYWFPTAPVWQLLALVALILGRFWTTRGAGTTNVVWGIIAYDWRVAFWIVLISGTTFTLMRDRQKGRLLVLFLLPLIIAIQRQSVAETLAAMLLAVLIGWFYSQIPDDLDLADEPENSQSQTMFRFFRGNRALRPLRQPVAIVMAGQKAATLSQLSQWGFAVPQGWILSPGDDPELVIAALTPSPEHPLVVRSSAIGEDTETASAAGQYQSVLNVRSRQALRDAIATCQDFYDHPTAVQYRLDRGLPDQAMAVLIQRQIQGVFSGVAFSRDPLAGERDVVVIETLKGQASQVVSGRYSPARYTLAPTPEANDPWQVLEPGSDRPEGGEDAPPLALLYQVASLVRELEARFRGIPQDLEWSDDGQQLWVLQTRPITNLRPIWTRKIAAEVIPGVISPLTWSINSPLTCGVWGQLFARFLHQGKDTPVFDFQTMAKLFYGRAYFNATLLGEVFLQMGLPPTSLEFLTRGTSMGRPSLGAMVGNVPGLLRLIRDERRLDRQFYRQDYPQLQSILTQLQQQPVGTLSPAALVARGTTIQSALTVATYYQIMVPIGTAVRQKLLQLADQDLDRSQLPEVRAMRALEAIATDLRAQLFNLDLMPQAAEHQSDLMAWVLETPVLATIHPAIATFFENYGYLSEVTTDIAVPNWLDDPRPLNLLLWQTLQAEIPIPKRSPVGLRGKWLRSRLMLKGQVAEVYNQLLAHLRWTILALEEQWVQAETLDEPGDIFFLEWAEIEAAVQSLNPAMIITLRGRISDRRQDYQRQQELTQIPTVIYGNSPSPLAALSAEAVTLGDPNTLQGIGASAGQAEGIIQIVPSFRELPAQIGREMILVVPYTDAGWGPVLARSGGIIAEVGGQLSHGAIVAREYGIPAIMEVHQASQRLRNGQRVRIDGRLGTILII